jgi:hypothetical protein
LQNNVVKSANPTHASPCCCRPVRPQRTYSCEPIATAQWNARGPGPPTAEEGGRNHRSLGTSSTAA